MPLGPDIPHCTDECVNGFCHNGECICIVGYEKDTDGGPCHPICSMGCKNGKCVEPEICECDNGYKPSSMIFDCVPICEAGCAICKEPFTCLVKYLPKIITSTAPPLPTQATTVPLPTLASTMDSIPLTHLPPLFMVPTSKPTPPSDDNLIIANDPTKLTIEDKNCEMKKLLESQILMKNRKLQNLKFVQFWQFDFSD